MGITPEERWDQICEAEDKGQWASLLELCALYQTQVPDHVEVRIPHAIALRNLHRFEEAAALMQEAHNGANASVKFKYHCQCELGRIFEETGRFDDARTAYEVAHQLFPMNTGALIYRGVVDLRTGDFAAARDWLSRALDCPDGALDETHFNIGSAYLAEQNYPKAIEHYQRAITLDPNYDIAWERLADAKRAVEIREQSK